jgi:hypothetical protein
MTIYTNGQEDAVRLCRHHFAPEGALPKIEPWFVGAPLGAMTISAEG